MKKFFLFILFVAIAFAGFSQKRAKTKTKSNKTQTSTTIPNPGNPSSKPELGEPKPVIYTTDVPGSSPTPGQVGAPTTKPKDSTIAPGSTGVGQQPTGTAPGVGVPGSPTQAPGSSDTKPMTTDPNPGDGNHKPGMKDQKQHKGEKGNKDHQKEHKGKHDGEKHDHDDDDANGNGNDKVRTNVPSQVEKAFKVDYPAATNPVWTKQNGDWTVTFNNNGAASTATYHSNGEKPSHKMPGQKKEMKEKKEKKNKG
jgi:hypothetical protein